MTKHIPSFNRNSKCFYKSAILFFLIISVLKTNAQEDKNSTGTSSSSDNGMSAEIKELENFKKLHAKEVEALEIFTKKFIEARNNGVSKTMALPDTSCVATIPVVIHVFHPNGSAGVPMSQINYAMRDLYITFGGADADYGTVNAAFSSVKSYTKIRFVLAKIDPKGNATTGVEYYKDKDAGYGNGTGWDNVISSIAWDNYKYFNIYVMNDLYANNVTNNSGVCWYPNTGMSDIGTARMVYNYWYLGQGGSSFNNLEFNETFTHECGHYMNLYHTFDGNNCAGPGDYCNDTPPTAVAAGGCSGTQCSGLINGENYMDYNTTCYKNFTMDQNARMEAALMDPSRFPLWQYDNNVATGILSATNTNSCVNTTPFFSFSKTRLNEAIINDGSIETPPVIIYACAGAQFANTNQTLVQGTDYTLANLPAGLTASIVTSSDGKTATLTLNGQAASHGTINSVSNINFAFTNAAVVGGSVTGITNYSNTFKIKFLDPWGLTCSSPVNYSASPTTTWTQFETVGPMPRYYAVSYSSGSFYLENYGRAIITNATTNDNVVFLPSGTSIDANSGWRAGGNHGLMYSPTYTVLDGQTGYVGFRTQAGNDYYYGYMTVQVSSTGGVTVLEYIYNNKPNDPIIAGENCTNVGITKLGTMNAPLIYPNPTSGNIFVKNINSNLLGGECFIYSVDGKIVKRESITSENMELNLENFKPGFYILEFNSVKNDGGKVRIKVIKN